MASDKILFVLHNSPMREVSEGEALKTLSEAELVLPREIVWIDTRAYAADIEGGHWRSSHAHLRQETSRIRSICDKWGATIVRYLGIAEVPHLLALGGYIGDERLVDARDFDRDRNTWEWQSADGHLSVETLDVPREPVVQPGSAVVRVEISYPILDSDVEAAIGKERLCDIRIRPKGRPPTPGIVKSASDVSLIRSMFREILAAIVSYRPNADVIHLFVAAPVSACIAIGQELRLRNVKEVQTYRYRSGTSNRALTPAILLTSGDVTEGARELIPEDIALARDLRKTWQAALEDVRAHARRARSSAASSGGKWYAGLEPAQILAEIKPLHGLKPMWELIRDEDTVSLDSRPQEFEFCKEPREWRLGDHLLLRMFEAAGRDLVRLRLFARLFFWHEYVHEWQGLTTFTSIDVGRLANCLERIDYLADAYAILHQLDFLIHENSVDISDDRACRNLLLDQVQVALRSFWTFEDAPPTVELQERRLRRYLNWYWRRVQLRDSPNLRTALRVLARQPCIEVSGLRRRVSSERVFIVLHEPGGFERLHIGVVLEDGRLERRGSSADASVEELLRAFSLHNHSAIERFFNALWDHVRQNGGGFPAD